MWAPMVFALCVGTVGTIIQGHTAVGVCLGAAALVILVIARVQAKRRARMPRPTESSER